MSRTVIAVVVAAVIAALTAIAYFVTSTSFAQRARSDADARLEQAHQLIGKLSQLGGIDVANKAERLAALPEFVKAVKTDSESERQQQARIGFQRFLAKEGNKPDIIALVHASGTLLAMNEMQSVIPKQWQNDKGEPIIPALTVVLGRKVIVSEFWNQDSGKGLMRIGVAPVIDPDAPINPQDPEGVSIIGAIVVAYAQTAKESQRDAQALGTEIAYTDGKRVVVSSFTRGGVEDTAKTKALTELLAAGAFGAKEEKHSIELGGQRYLVSLEQMPRSATKDLPKDYPPITAGAVLLSPIGAAANEGTIELFIVLLGVGALAMAMLGLYLVHRRLIAQVDQVELGVTDIINGNLDRTFRPVGAELDGLSNGLNVMLSRLLGRPEPGDEELDDDGNPMVSGRVEFEDGEDRAPAIDPDIAALAQELEPDYYKRVYTEYVAARRASGTPDEVSFESFIAKLKVNEGKLKAQYQCRAVRFRVVTKDGKVSLKPVPIFA
jgi:hypothetical protein